MNKDDGRALQVVARPHVFVRLTSVGMLTDRPLAYDEWADIGPGIGTGQRAYAFAAGDWLAYGENNFPDKYEQAMNATDLSLGRLRNLKSMCARVHISVRSPVLSISHHESVAPLPQEYQIQMLELAEQYDIDRDTFRGLCQEVISGANPDDIGDEDQIVVKARKPSNEEVWDKARHVVLAWYGTPKPEGMSMTLYQALNELAELLGEDDGRT